MRLFITRPKNWLFKKSSLRCKLNLVFGLFFIVPIMGLIYFGLHYDSQMDPYLPMLFVILLAASLFGLILLRPVFGNIARLSQRMSVKVQSLLPKDQSAMVEEDEVGHLARLFDIINVHLNDTHQALTNKKQEITLLKELSELCYITADPDEMLHVTLERALAMTDSDIGSIMLLDQPGRKRFVVRAAIGLGHWGKTGTYVDFESSIAKYAVLNKSPMVIKDIEKDARFGRANWPQYGTKAFVCMPIKTSREIIGVLNISRKQTVSFYPSEVIDLLEPLVSNAAFTYDNLLLTAENRYKEHYLKAIQAVLDILRSSVSGNEMLRACLEEIRSVISFDAAFLFKIDRDRPDGVEVQELMSMAPGISINGKHFPVSEGTVLDKVIRSQGIVFLSDTNVLFDQHQMDVAEGQRARQVYLMPLKEAGNVAGVLAMVMPETASVFPEHPFFPWISRCLALALEHMRLYDAVMKRNRELDSIRQIGSVLASSTFDIKQVLNYTMEMIRTIMDVQAGALYLVNGKELDFAASFNIASHQRKSIKLKLGQGIPGHVAARGETIVVHPNQVSPMFKMKADDDKDFSIESAMCVPMISQGRVIGVIEVLNKNTSGFSHSDEDLLQSIASSVSIAVENANLYNETVTMAENERGIRRIFQKFVPKEVLEQILRDSASGTELTEELKTLTLLNIDIRGFSKLLRSLGPQKTVSVLNAYFSMMGSIVFKHNGIVDKYLGDGFLAIFGAPVSSTRDADNALNAALEMMASLEFLNDEHAKDVGIELKLGISVHTGEVVVGNIGFEMKMDYTVIGDAVNDVFLLQEMSRDFPNSIIISDVTMRAARMKLNYLELEERLGEMKIYELLGKSY